MQAVTGAESAMCRCLVVVLLHQHTHLHVSGLLQQNAYVVKLIYVPVYNKHTMQRRPVTMWCFDSDNNPMAVKTNGSLTADELN